MKNSTENVRVKYGEIMIGRVARICTSFIDVPEKISVAIYFVGCSIRCSACQNKELWDPKGGYEVTSEQVAEKINNHPLAEYVVMLGGEPTDQPGFLLDLCKKITKPIALYTGREFEDLSQALLEEIDVIICGPYRHDLHVGGWPASSNQRVLMKKDGSWICQTTHSSFPKIF